MGTGNGIYHTSEAAHPKTIFCKNKNPGGRGFAIVMGINHLRLFLIKKFPLFATPYSSGVKEG